MELNRGGGIVTPLLLNVYMDELSVALSNLNTGARVAGKVTNHIA